MKELKINHIAVLVAVVLQFAIEVFVFEYVILTGQFISVSGRLKCTTPGRFKMHHLEE